MYVGQHLALNNHADKFVFYKRYSRYFIAIDINFYRLGKVVWFKQASFAEFLRIAGDDFQSLRRCRNNSPHSYTTFGTAFNVPVLKTLNATFNGFSIANC